jgi:peptidoglycan/LPS O-acetylase OafA/YrhL
LGNADYDKRSLPGPVQVSARQIVLLTLLDRTTNNVGRGLKYFENLFREIDHMHRDKRFQVLDSFRGLCALFVVIYHIHATSSVAELAFFRGSSVFVEFFFVLSGFVLAHGYAFRENLSFGPFLSARFFRLYPLHLFMLLVFVCLELGKWGATQYLEISFNNGAFTNDYDPQGLLANLMLVHAWTPYTNPLSFNTPSWSISIEFYMYLLLYLSLLMAYRLKLLMWGLIPVLMFFLIFSDSDLLVSPVMRGLSGFFGGAICYLIYRAVSSRLHLSKRSASVLEVSLIALVIWVVQGDVVHRSAMATMVFYLVVFCFALEGGYLSTFFKHRGLQFLGRHSYSIYLTHAAVIYIFTSVFLLLQKLYGWQLMSTVDGVRFFDIGSAFLNNALVILLLGTVLICSIWTYRHVEQKGQAFGKRWLSTLSKEVEGNRVIVRDA